MEDVDIFYGHFVYFCPFGLFCGHLVYLVCLFSIFSPFWYVVPRKIWQPYWEAKFVQDDSRLDAFNITTYIYNIFSFTYSGDLVPTNNHSAVATRS
jgi:hypothetical protein